MPAQGYTWTHDPDWLVYGTFDTITKLNWRTGETQEVYGLMMAHYAVRGLMHEAALTADEDPDRLFFTRAVRVVRRKLPAFVASPPRSGGLRCMSGSWTRSYNSASSPAGVAATRAL